MKNAAPRPGHEGLAAVPVAVQSGAPNRETSCMQAYLARRLLALILRAMAVCKTDQPLMRSMGGERAVACHLHAG
jgi:hypothetical protein